MVLVETAKIELHNNASQTAAQDGFIVLYSECTSSKYMYSNTLSVKINLNFGNLNAILVTY